MPESKSVLLAASAALAMLLLPAPSARAQNFIKCPTYGDKLEKVPEITRDAEHHKLQAVLKVSDQERIVWFNNPTAGQPPFCASQHMRFFEGYSRTHAKETWPVSSSPAEPLPGPTFRARVGDLVEISFLNQVDLTNFPNSEYFDRAEQGLGTGCDETAGIYPKGGAINDTFPNCFHGSSTANIHFHGTHTNPSSTGDNVLIQIRPSPRKDGKPVVSEASVRRQFDAFFEHCESQLGKHVPSGWPTLWSQMPELYRQRQKELLKAYDTKVPEPQKLWPPNKKAIDSLQWPQFYIGAYPYCFQLPEYKEPPAGNDDLQMGQSPGTQWYHMHKHGSTTLNVSNTLIGAFIIEGDYDDQLQDFYKKDDAHKNWGLDEKVLVLQQVGVTPNMERASQRSVPQFSVNGRREPMVEMKPGQVQMWRIVNGAHRSGAYFVPPTGIQWVQIAQDGVQYKVANYHPPAEGAPSQGFLMAAGNRVDLLVRVPATLGPGDYKVQIMDVVQSNELPGQPKETPRVTLLTVHVPAAGAGDPDPAMPFISDEKFPKQPPFLEDIPEKEALVKRELTFASTNRGNGANHTINNKKFGDLVDQAMLLNTVEEWKIVNTTSDASGQPGPIMHPFHIHINPFQIVEVFAPWDPRYVFDPAKYVKDTNCYVDPNDPTTWHACELTKLKPPFIWWDVFAIPGGRKVGNVVIPGHFRMRSRFSDYTGQYVLHCHILAHEDRGMMELVEVVPNTTVMKHH